MVNPPGKVIDKIKKLLRLAGNNPSKEEAALAAKRAEELIEKFNISRNLLEDSDDQLLDYIIVDAEYSSFLSVLLNFVSELNNCVSVQIPNFKKQFRVIGDKLDIIKTVELCENVDKQRRSYQFYTYKNNNENWHKCFERGLLSALIDRLKEKQVKTNEFEQEKKEKIKQTCQAIILASTALAENKRNKILNNIGMQNFKHEINYDNLKFEQGPFILGRQFGYTINLQQEKKLGEKNV